MMAETTPAPSQRLAYGERFDHAGSMSQLQQGQQWLRSLQEASNGVQQPDASVAAGNDESFGHEGSMSQLQHGQQWLRSLQSSHRVHLQPDVSAAAGKRWVVGGNGDASTEEQAERLLATEQQACDTSKQRRFSTPLVSEHTMAERLLATEQQACDTSKQRRFSTPHVSEHTMAAALRAQGPLLLPPPAAHVDRKPVDTRQSDMLLDQQLDDVFDLIECNEDEGVQALTDVLTSSHDSTSTSASFVPLTTWRPTSPLPRRGQLSVF